MIKMSSETVRELMSLKVTTLSPKRPTFDALRAMISHDYGCIVVTERGKVVGIITERDIVQKITKSFDYLNRPLSETASKPVISILPETPVWEAFTLMLRKGIRRLPVIKNEKLEGLVTERDLFKWVVKVAYEPSIPKDIKKLLVRKK
jgi:CBS domain-containing protein